MTSVSVLVQYLRHKRVLSVPRGATVSSLKEAFRNSFEVHSTAITFQKFDSRFDDYVDITEDDALVDRDKLIVTVAEEVQNHEEVCEHKLDDDIELQSTDDIAVGSEVVVSPKRKRKKVVKTVDDTMPLPEPYPLPKHFRSDIEQGLKSKKMSLNSRRLFVTDVAATMLSSKLYPTKDDYINVARSIIREYPFLKAPPGAGTPHGALVMELQSRFKEFRREKKVLKSSSSGSTHVHVLPKPVQKYPGITKDIPSPQQIVGEDSFSFEQHNKLLRSEFAKSKPNKHVISEIMDLSFPMRRHDIINNGYVGVRSLFEQYPLLQDYDQLVIEMCRIIAKPSNYINTVAETWDATLPIILEQAKVESKQNSRLKSIFQDIDDDTPNALYGLVTVPYIIPDPKGKLSHLALLNFIDTDEYESEIDNIQINTPYLLVEGTIQSPSKVCLVTDRTLICEVPLESSVFALLSAYFVFYIKYPSGFNNFFSFLEVILLGFTAEKVSTTVKHLLASISKES